MSDTIFLIGNNFLKSEALQYTLKNKGYDSYIGSFQTAIKQQVIFDIEPDVLIWQEQLIELRKKSIFNCLKKIKIACSSIFILSNSTFSMLGMGLTNGIQGYAHKQGGIKELENCLVSLEMDSVFISPLLTGDQQQVQSYETQSTGTSDAYLTNQEKKILRLVNQSKTNKEIAGHLNLSPKTVKNHRQNMCNKLGLRGYGRLYEFSIQYFE